jgi:hypothetical protein
MTYFCAFTAFVYCPDLNPIIVDYDTFAGSLPCDTLGGDPQPPRFLY